jgi:hypothetical protein
MFTRSLEIRSASETSAWINSECVACDTWLDPPDMVVCGEVYCDGQATGFPVCEDCWTLPPATLARRLHPWADDVLIDEVTH